MLSPQTLGLTALAGVSSHVGFFIRGEHHIQAPIIFRTYLILAGSIFLLRFCAAGTNIACAATEACLLILSYGTALICSMLVYRVLFHRLREFPGPRIARASKLWNVFNSLHSTNFRLMEKMRCQYGDFVRTGPNEISIFNPEAVRALDGPGTNCSKSAWYDIMQPRISVATTRDKEDHKQRRKVWERAFRQDALQEYESRILDFASQLDRKLREINGEPVNVSRLFYLYSFDVMSDLAFGEPLKMLETDDFHFTVGLLQDGMDLLGPLSPVPWLVRIGFSIPGVAQNFKKLLSWSAQKLRYRIEHEPAKRDVMSWLLETSIAKDTLKEDADWLRGDAFALIVAGSDTVASTLISIFYHLAEDPCQISKLRAELQHVDARDVETLRSKQHLTGVIYEALRLHPALPSGGLRETPPEGLTIAGRYIPGKVVVSVPRYSIGRLESHYERPHDFVPERWYSKAEMVRNDAAFFPFSIGRYSCIGKNLALMQIRSVVALLIERFDVTLAPHEDGVAVWRDLKDQFNAHPGKLDLLFLPREK